MTTTPVSPHRERRRHLPVPGTYNLRDIGGYPTRDGATTRWHTLLRADSLHRLAPEDQAALVDLGLGTVVDLRREHEREEWPNVFAAHPSVRYASVSLTGDGSYAPRDGTRWTLGQFYVALLEHRAAGFAEVFTALAETGEDQARLVHCTAGKDRTGVVVALALDLAGVPEAVIVEDYTLTSQYLGDQYYAEARVRAEKAGQSWETYQQQLICPADYMEQFLAALDGYGGAATYLRDAGVDPAALASLRRALVDAA